jgi:20S proteasome alpha/beta subunit
VTVCIAAIADKRKHIALVSDSKVAFGEFSADRAVRKNVPLLGEYVVLCAGNDAARADTIYNRVRKQLVDKSPEPSVDEIAEALFMECKRERDRIVEGKILSKHGYDTTTFREKGKQLCTAAVFFDIHSAMAQISLSLDFIIAGFDEKGEPHLRFTNCETPPEDYDSLGFYAIGSGAHAALSSMTHAVEHLIFSRYRDTGTVLYHAMAAKFMAESARDVGKDTFAVVIGHNESPKFISVFDGDEYVRERWKSEGAPRVPNGIGGAIEDLLADSNEFNDEKVLEKVAKYCPRAGERLKEIRAEKAAKLLTSETSKYGQ